LLSATLKIEKKNHLGTTALPQILNKNR